MASKKRPKRPRKSAPAPAAKGGQGNLNQLMAQAQAMQKKLQAAEEETNTYTGESSVGGGAVTCTVNADHQITDLHIDPSVVDPEDIEMLQDLITAGINEAMSDLDAKVGETISAASDGYDLSSIMPGFPQL